LHEGGKGCLHLIRDGAKMVEVIDDVLEELAPLYQLQQELFTPHRTIEDTPPELAGLLQLVGFEAITLEELVLSSGLPIARVLADLSALELAGEVARCAGGYIRC
jgi:DNA processing protein